MSVIVALSGGKASAWCANWALEHFPKNDVILYFNDTKWEHPDLYRFINDLEIYLQHKITVDADGRSPEELFHDHHAIANNRMPFCSHELKALRLQQFFKDGDKLVFGISSDEAHRAERIVGVYQVVAVKTNKWPKLLFPLVSEKVSREQVDSFIDATGIQPPSLYSLGFTHNNCSGGCVRAGKKQWKLLYEKLPAVYAERERVEEEMRTETGKDIHILKDETLAHFRGRIDRRELSAYYYDPEEDQEQPTECVGICNTFA